MTLIKLEARSGLGSLLSLPFDDISDGYSVQGIDGLDPVKATIVSSAYATQDGDQFHSARREKRNIVLALGLEPDYAEVSARQLRNRLYEFFMPKSEVALRFISDEESTVDIGGRVESFEAPLFTQKPVATISVICFDPDFYELTSTAVSGNSVADLTEKQVTYSGTVETGFILRLKINRDLTEFSIKNRSTTNEVWTMDFVSTFQAGDVVEVSTIQGARGVYLIRNNVRSSLLYALSPYSPWNQLFPGVNYIRVAATGAAIPYTIEYVNKYGGL